MRLSKTIAFAAILATAGTAPVAAQTLDFEGLADIYVTTYGGFNFTGGFGDGSWVNGGVLDFFTAASHNGAGYAWSNGGTWLEFSRGTAFSFNSVNLWSGNCGQSQTVRGYLGATQVASSTVAMSCSSTQQHVFNFSNVDRVRFEYAYPNQSNVVVDDINYGEAAPSTVTPEPISMTLLGTGLAGIAAARKRRRNKTA